MAFCISFGKVDKFITFPLIGSIFKFFFRMIVSKNKNNQNKDINNDPIILCISTYFGMSLSLFLYIIYYEKNKYSKKTENNKNLNSPLSIELEYNNQYEMITYNKFKYILVSSLLNFIFYFVLYTYFFELIINYWFFDILFIFVFSHYIFRIKLYKHQYLCMIIIFILSALLNIFIALYNDKELYQIDNLLHHVLKIFGEIVFSLVIVINKYTIEKKFSSPYEICFYQGIISLILFLLIALIFPKLCNLSEYWSKLDVPKFLEFLAISATQFIYNLFLLITIRYYTTFHVLLPIIFCEIHFYLFNIFSNLIVIFPLIGFSFVFFVFLLFVEIIEINYFGLQKNTKKNISIRAEIDEKLCNEDDEDSQRTESEQINDSAENSNDNDKDNESEKKISNNRD